MKPINNKRPIINPEEVTAVENKQNDSQIKISKEIKIISIEEYEKLRAKEEELQNTIELLQRTRADYLNYIKMARKQLEEMKEYALTDFFRKIIQYLTMLDTATIHCNNTDNIKAIKEGLELITCEFKKILNEEGLQEIKPENTIFDPQIAEAVEIVETDKEEEDSTIVEVVTKGYKFKDIVLTPAKVKIKKYTNKTQVPQNNTQPT